MVPSASPQLVSIYASVHQAGRDQTVHKVSSNLRNHSNQSKPKNGGQCFPSAGKYICQCPPGWKGPDCSQGESDLSNHSNPNQFQFLTPVSMSHARMVASASPRLVNIYVSAHQAGRDQTVHRVSRNSSNHSNPNQFQFLTPVSMSHARMVASASPRLVIIYASAHQAGRDPTVHKVSGTLSNHSNPNQFQFLTPVSMSHARMVASASPRLVIIYASAHQAGRDQTVHKVSGTLSNHSNPNQFQFLTPVSMSHARMVASASPRLVNIYASAHQAGRDPTVHKVSGTLSNHSNPNQFQFLTPVSMSHARMVASASPRLVIIYASAHQAGRDQTVHRVSTNLSNHSNPNQFQFLTPVSISHARMVPSASPL